MNIFRILINQNPVWGVSGFSCFFILLTVVIIYEHYMYINTKVSFKQMIARILLFIYLWTVLESTVFTRVPQAHPQYELQVFWSWKAIFHYHDRELLKENILNCMLLMPYGCMIPVVVGKSYICILTVESFKRIARSHVRDFSGEIIAEMW